MKNKLVLTYVVALHCAAVGALMVIQGCGTTGSPVVVSDPPPPVMPPPYEAQPIPTKRPITRHGVQPAEVTPTPAPDPVAHTPSSHTPSWGGETTEYVVRKGDSLSVIARRYDLRVSDIVALNAIADKDVIRVGQKLLLPGRVNLANPRPATTGGTPASTEAPELAGHERYVVRKGDSLSVIAYRNSVSTQALRELNGITGDRILVGQELYLPKGARPRSASSTETSPAPRTQPDRPVESRPPQPRIEPAQPQPSQPEARAPQPAASSTAGSDAGDSDDYIIHVVQPDEDVYAVAMRYTVLPEDVKRINGLSDYSLTPGQKLKIRVPRSGN